MKTLFFALALFASQVFAAELNLNGGESARIQANVETLVTCNGAGSGNCSSKTAAFASTIDHCMGSMSARMCIEKFWPNWKVQNPSCLTEGIAVCMEKCTNTSAMWCTSYCQ